jgi:hypothetical protein
MILDYSHGPIRLLAAGIVYPADRFPRLITHETSDESLEMHYATLCHSFTFSFLLPAARDFADDVPPQPQLPVECGGFGCGDIDLDVVHVVRDHGIPVDVRPC